VKNVGPYEIVDGNPAKVLKQRFDIETINLLLKLNWWDLPLDIIKDIETKLCSTPDHDFIKKLIDQYRN
jgi:hypothetical protein